MKKATVRQLIEKLHEFPPEAAIALESVDNADELFIFNFGLDHNELTIFIASEDEEELEDDEN